VRINARNVERVQRAVAYRTDSRLGGELLAVTRYERLASNVQGSTRPCLHPHLPRGAFEITSKTCDVARRRLSEFFQPIVAFCYFYMLLYQTDTSIDNK